MSCHRNTTLDNNPNNTAIVSLGANLESACGTAADTVTEALKSLEAMSSRCFRASSLYLTSPIDCPPDTPDFVNAIAVFDVDSGLSPEQMLQRLQAVEAEFGRVPAAAKNAPRALDLDLIAFGGQIRNTPQLQLPHPRASTRRFVLEPLAELQPHLRLPGQTNTVTELLQTLDSTQKSTRIT